MILMREPKQTPKILVWYHMNPLNYDSEGSVSLWEKVPIRYYDGTTMYTTDIEETDYIYNPTAVLNCFAELNYRDTLYNSAGIIIHNVIGQNIPIYREDINGTVILGILAEYINFGSEVYSALLEEFSEEIASGKLIAIWGDQ